MDTERRLAVFILLTDDNISHFHRIDADEVWYYHAGDSLTIHMINPDGTYTTATLGTDIQNGDVLQYVVPKEQFLLLQLKI